MSMIYKELTVFELRDLTEYLWMGSAESVRVMGQVNQFKRGVEVLQWLANNKIRGKDIIDFFSDAEGVETRGVLIGVQKVLERIDKGRVILTAKDLN